MAPVPVEHHGPSAMEMAVNRSQQSKRIDEEIVCADALVHHLKEHCGCRRTEVRRERDDPPDFWIDVDGTTYAVEVTSIVTGEAYRAACRELKEVVDHDAKQKGILSGTYALTIVRRPRLPQRTSPEWRKLVDSATSFMEESGSAGSTGETRVLDTTEGHLGIMKLTPTAATVVLLSTESKWGREAHQDMQCLMQKAVRSKRKKLEEKGIVSRCAGVVLAFYDAYGFGDSRDAKHCLLQTCGYDWFHSVFWAASFTNRPNELSSESPGRDGDFLYSKAAEWGDGS